MYKLNHTQMAWRLAQDIPSHCQVFLGQGLPQQIPTHFPTDKTANFQNSRTDSVDISIIAADQISELGDLVSTESPADTGVIVAITDFFDEAGLPKIMPLCTQATTAKGRVASIYTDVAVFDIIDGTLTIREIFEGIDLLTLQGQFDVEMAVSPELCILRANSV